MPYKKGVPKTDEEKRISSEACKKKWDSLKAAQPDVSAGVQGSSDELRSFFEKGIERLEQLYTTPRSEFDVAKIDEAVKKIDALIALFGEKLASAQTVPESVVPVQEPVGPGDGSDLGLDVLEPVTFPEQEPGVVVDEHGVVGASIGPVGLVRVVVVNKFQMGGYSFSPDDVVDFPVDVVDNLLNAGLVRKC